MLTLAFMTKYANKMYGNNVDPIVAFLLFLISMGSQAGSVDEKIDVVNYDVTIEPEIGKRYIKGTVKISLETDPHASQVILNSGNLEIDHVTGESVVGFRQSGGKVIIELSRRESNAVKVTIDYHGTPSSGLLFNPQLGHAYTVYFTSHWMVCNDSPNDKAMLSLNVLIPDDKHCVASGVLIQKSSKEGKTLYSWRLDQEAPAYTYGFVIGNFNTWEQKHGDISLRYFSGDYTSDELRKIFEETPGMVAFFEERSGVEYYQPTYSQMLIGDHYQEMSGLSVLKNAYGRNVLKDSTETNLISHELAHQWWGNQITCERWSHFWLNEAFATYMSAAYNEDRFGKEKYKADINSYFTVYQGIKKRGNDRSLVFEQWSNPSMDDRNLVYFKGAYVLHLLREEIGDQAFWKGIKFYSQRHFGKAVETDDFKLAMEESSGKDLDAFFNEWIYRNAR